MPVIRNIDQDGASLIMQYIRDISSTEYRSTVNASVKMLGAGRYQVEINLPKQTVKRNKKGQFSNDSGVILERVLTRLRNTGYPLAETEQ